RLPGMPYDILRRVPGPRLRGETQMRARACPHPGCPNLVAKGRCPDHSRLHEELRGTRYERGYGAEYDAERRLWKRMVDAGGVACRRCGEPTEPGPDWSLGHDDDDRSIIRGPEHGRKCNYSAAGTKSRPG